MNGKDCSSLQEWKFKLQWQLQQSSFYLFFFLLPLSLLPLHLSMHSERLYFSPCSCWACVWLCAYAWVLSDFRLLYAQLWPWGFKSLALHPSACEFAWQDIDFLKSGSFLFIRKTLTSPSPHLLPPIPTQHKNAILSYSSCPEVTNKVE